MKRISQFTGLLLAVILLGLSAACSGETQSPAAQTGAPAAQEAGAKTFNVDGAGKVVGVATQHMGNAWNKNSVQAIKDILEPYGFRINHQDGGGNTQAQVAAVETFITQRVDYIIVSGGEGGAFNAVSLQAQRAGIPVIAIDMFLDGGITGIMCDNWSGGVQMGIYAVNQMKGEGKYILLDTSGWATLLDRGEGAESVLSSFSKITKIGSTREVAASDPVTQGYQITKAALQANPDIKAVLVTWNMPAIGVYNALTELNKVNQVTIISADTGDDVISAMLERGAGAWGFMGQNSYELGTLAANSVLTHITGGTVPFAQIGTTYFVTNDDYIHGDIKTVKIQDPQEHWKEVLEPVLGPLQID
ncbi:MAG: sugar ABC transporter substrate-binding protein [Spirochaetales bacterium]|jgi:ribose transport system substrate-binding protein|nr:sugar ABC transporter substrate-binding protein [Spirochaetales bacterium]